jgi:hypothetical protein
MCRWLSLCQWCGLLLLLQKGVTMTEQKKIVFTVREYLTVMGGLSLSLIGNVLFLIWIARML